MKTFVANVKSLDRFDDDVGVDAEGWEVDRGGAEEVLEFLESVLDRGFPDTEAVIYVSDVGAVGFFQRIGAVKFI